MPSRAEYEHRLSQLAKRPSPKRLSPGAMCYAPENPCDCPDYVCPNCGEKTLAESMSSLAPCLELEDCRRLVGQIGELNARLLETGFCRRCFPDAEEPSLDLEIRHGDGTKHCVRGITSEDLTLLDEFLRGEDKHRDRYDGETPIRRHSRRLRHLLGLSDKAK